MTKAKQEGFSVLNLIIHLLSFNIHKSLQDSSLQARLKNIQSVQCISYRYDEGGSSEPFFLLSSLVFLPFYHVFLFDLC